MTRNRNRHILPLVELGQRVIIAMMDENAGGPAWRMNVIALRSYS